MMRVHLRAVTDEDVGLFFEHQNDHEAAEMAAFQSRDREAHLAHWDRIRADPGALLRAVETDNGVAGNVVSWQAEDHREIGYWIDKELWGRGIATDAVRAFLDVDPVRPLYAYVAEHNVGSIKVLERCGFERARLTTTGGVRYVVMMLT
jgi:RimJ/RimL family protein N-acetyltransferase